MVCCWAMYWLAQWLTCWLLCKFACGLVYCAVCYYSVFKWSTLEQPQQHCTPTAQHDKTTTTARQRGG